MSWQKVKLGDVCDFVTGKTPPTSESKYFDGGVLWVTPSDFISKSIDKTGRTLSDLAIIDRKCNFLPKDTVVLSCIGDIGKVGILTREGCTNQQITAILPSNLFNSSFLYYLLMFKRNELTSLANSAVVPILNNANLRRLEIPLPPLDVQKKIADILDTADALRKKDAELIKKYDELAQSIFIDMFGDPVTNPKAWGTKKFGDYIVTLTDYHANGSYEILKQHVTLKNTPDYALMIRTIDLENQDFNDNVNYISEDAYHFLSKSKVLGGDIIINKIGSAGNLYLMPELNKPVSLGMNAFLIRCNALVNQKFIFYLLKTPFGMKEIKSRVFGAVTKTITKDAVRDIPIYDIPLELQNSYINSVEKVNNSINILKNNNSEQLFQSLLQRAFNGELVN